MRTRSHPVDYLVGENIRRHRQQLGFSQGQLAQSVGLTLQQIQKYEQGANHISASKLYEISQALDISVHQLFAALVDKAEVSADSELQALRISVDRLVAGLIDEAEIAADSESLALALEAAFARISHPGVRRSIVILVQALAVNANPDLAETDT